MNKKGSRKIKKEIRDEWRIFHSVNIMLAQQAIKQAKEKTTKEV